MALRLDPRTSRPAIRVRRAPALDPPFDDEATPGAWGAAASGQLALRWAGPGSPDSPATRTASAPQCRAAQHSPYEPATAGAAGPPDRPAVGPVGGPSAEARTASRQFLNRCVEILNGYRPIGHLRQLSALVETTTIMDNVTIAIARVAQLRAAAGVSSRAGRRLPTAEVSVRPRLLRVCEPRPGVAEATAILFTAGRTWALTFRLERATSGWLATAVAAV